MTFEIGGRGKATIVFPMPDAYTSPTSPGSAPSDSQSTLLYQHSDHLTTRVTTDNAGTLSNQQAHYPFGESWYASGAADGSVQRKFTSYRKEGGSLASGQINYAIARYHGARIGRFHRPDPVRGNFRNPQRLNRYAYVTNNPVRYIDPKGRDMVDLANANSSDGWNHVDNLPVDRVVNYSAGEAFQLGSLHYASGSSFNQEAYAAYVANIEAIWQNLRNPGGNGAVGTAAAPHRGSWLVRTLPRALRA